jgi:serine O-acetyltransferase
MSWLQLYRQDLERYVSYSQNGPLRQMLMQQGLWALFQYRLASAVYQSHIPAFIKHFLLLVFTVWQKIIEITTGISLPYTAQIGPGFYIGHFGQIIINGYACIGSGCNISQGVTIGVSGRGDQRGVPTLGDRVYIGANAVIAGKIYIGNDTAIGANSLVITDLPEHCTALGVPAVRVNAHGSEEYIAPKGHYE